MDRHPRSAAGDRLFRLSTSSGDLDLRSNRRIDHADRWIGGGHAGTVPTRRFLLDHTTGYKTGDARDLFPHQKSGVRLFGNSAVRVRALSGFAVLFLGVLDFDPCANPASPRRKPRSRTTFWRRIPAI